MRYFFIAAFLTFGLYLVQIPVLIAWLLSITVATYMAYYFDKRAARNKGWRVSESMLLKLGFAGGTLGALAASQVHRHKTSKAAFRQKFWAGTIVQVLLIILVIYAIQMGKVPNILSTSDPVQNESSSNLMPSTVPAKSDRIPKRRPTPDPKSDDIVIEFL